MTSMAELRIPLHSSPPLHVAIGRFATKGSVVTTITVTDPTQDTDVELTPRQARLVADALMAAAAIAEAL